MIMKYWSLAIIIVAAASALTSCIVFSRMHGIVLPLTVEICLMSGLFLLLALFFWGCIFTVVLVILWIYFAWQFYCITKRRKPFELQNCGTPPSTQPTSCNPSPNPKNAVKIMKSTTVESNKLTTKEGDVFDRNEDDCVINFKNDDEETLF